MVNMSDRLEPEVDEAEQIFHEYRQGISQAIDRVRTKLLDRARQEASGIVDNANSEATNIVNIAQNKADTILAQANKEAEKIFKDAEEDVKREARERTRKEEERLISEAKTQSDNIINGARQAAAKLTDEILDDAKKEADRTIKSLTEESKREADGLISSASEIKEQAEVEASLIKKRAEEEAEHVIQRAQEESRRKEEEKLAEIIEKTRQEAEEILKNAREQALKERENLIAEIVQEGEKLAEFEKIKILSEAKSKAEYLVREIKKRLNSELEKSSLLINGAQEKLADIITEMSDQAAKEQFDIDTSMMVDVPPLEEVNADFTKEVEEQMLFSRTKDEEKNYEGKLELTILAPIDVKQKKDFEKLLTEIPDLNLMGDGGSSDGSNWLELELSQSIPLVSMIKQMPPVKKVASHGNNIIVALKSS